MMFPDYPRFTPKRLFDSFCEDFTNYEFPRNQRTLQDEMLEIFGQIGKEVGYQVSIEGFGDLDVMWQWNQPNSEISFIELALEHESRGARNEASFQAVLNEVRKLRHFKSRLKAIMYYPRTERMTLKDQIKRIREVAFASPLFQEPAEKWLVLGLLDFRFWEKEGTIWRPDPTARMWDLASGKILGDQRLKANFSDEILSDTSTDNEQILG